LWECTASVFRVQPVSHIEDTFFQISEEHFFNSALRVLCITPPDNIVKKSHACDIDKGIHSKLEGLELQGNQNRLLEQLLCGATTMISYSTNSDNFVRGEVPRNLNVMLIFCYELLGHMGSKRYSGSEAQILLYKMTECYGQVSNTPVLYLQFWDQILVQRPAVMSEGFLLFLSVSSGKC
jgi:hypothetical protein